MQAFVFCYSVDGTIIQASGVSEEYRQQNESVHTVEGKKWSDFNEDPDFKAQMVGEFNELIKNGGMLNRETPDQFGTNWQVKLVKVPFGTAAVSFATRLPGEMNAGNNLTSRDLTIIKMMCDDTPTEEIRAAVGAKNSASFANMTRSIRKKLGCNTNAGIVRYGILKGMATD